MQTIVIAIVSLCQLSNWCEAPVLQPRQTVLLQESSSSLQARVRHSASGRQTSGTLISSRVMCPADMGLAAVVAAGGASKLTQADFGVLAGAALQLPRVGVDVALECLKAAAFDVRRLDR